MSENHVLFLKADFQNWVTDRTKAFPPKIDPFTYYCCENYLKSHDPVDDDILYGITDGHGDGGVDAIYFILDRNEFIKDDSEIGNRKPSRCRLIVMQVKNAVEGFKMTEVEKMPYFMDDLLNINKPTTDPALVAKYNPKLLERMKTFKDKYLSIHHPTLDFSIDVFYITKGDEEEPDAKAENTAGKVKETVAHHMNKARFEYHFVNLQRLLEQVEMRISRNKTLTWAIAPMSADDGLVGIVRLADFYEFLRESDGELSERLFDSNVRGFQQNTAVNRQIRASLHADSTGTNFWLLNNGITIIATKCSTAGRQRANCEDPQIVNGLQTSREIFNHFKTGGSDPANDSRHILVRLIETTDEAVRDSIIKATNSQNKMDAASLRSTDPIHRSIEEVFRQVGLFYDRRKGFYKDQGKPVYHIVSVMELTKAVIAVAIQRPDDARARAGNHISDEFLYSQIFGKYNVDEEWEDAFPLPVYLNCVKIVREVDIWLYVIGYKGMLQGHEHNIKFYLAAYAAAWISRRVEPRVEDLAQFKFDLLKPELIEDCCKRLLKLYEKLGATDTVAKGPDLVKKMKAQIKLRLKRK